ncbi:hypothetical protein GCM10009548_50130 [Streptomyces malaysiensis subsp. malaysiensis]|uniref:hypothetical protein n=1 Tax=Streptomyces malaysiensis TaxID=92644 RepID=UPI002FE77887
MGNPNTVRGYSTGVGRTAERIGEARPLGKALELLYTWNARRAAAQSWLGWAGASHAATTARRSRAPTPPGAQSVRYDQGMCCCAPMTTTAA